MSNIHDILIKAAKVGMESFSKKAGDKEAFVPMPGGAAPPPMPADPAMGGAPMGGAPMGGAPMDPAMMGGMPPMDPAMMGGAPMDPAMMGGMPAGGPGMEGATSPLDPATLEAVRQVVREEMGGSGGEAAAGGGEKPKASGKVAVEERLTSIEQGLSKILGMLVGAGALPGSDIMPPSTEVTEAVAPPVPAGEMGSPVDETPQDAQKYAEVEQPISKADMLAEAIRTLRGRKQL